MLGDVKLRKIGPDSLDALYAHLRRCSRLCASAAEGRDFTLMGRMRAMSDAGRCGITGQVGRAGAMSGAGRAVHTVVARVDREGERDHLGGAESRGAVQVDRPEPGRAGHVAEAGASGSLIPPTPREAARLLNEVFLRTRSSGCSCGRR